MRTVKTAIAVFICLVLYEVMNRCALLIDGGSSGILGLIRLYLANCNILYALFAAVVGMQSTIQTSVKFGKNRILGTALGGVAGIVTVALLSLIKPDFLYLIIVPLGVAGVIYACNVLKLQDSIQIATIVYFIITVSIRNTANPVLYALSRWIDTVIGTIVALAVNSVVKSPHTDDRENG